MSSRLRSRIVQFAAGVLLVSVGCVDRTETIAVEAGGTVRVRIEWAADHESELFPGRVPGPGAGWSIVRSQRHADDGTLEKHLLEAERGFAPAADLPDGFFPVGDPHADAYLHHPTTLEIERRADGNYHHFRRIYPGRAWAYVAALDDQVKQAYEVAGDVEFEALPPEEQAAAVRMLAELEVKRTLVFARLAWRELEPASQDAWLDLRERVLLAMETFDARYVASMLGALRNGDNELALEIETQRFEATVRGAMVRAARDAGLDADDLAAFDAALDWHRRYHQLTQGLAAERFTINVEMPGEIVGTNANRVAGATATWTFDGSALRDRDLELLVTSVVR